MVRLPFRKKKISSLNNRFFCFLQAKHFQIEVVVWFLGAFLIREHLGCWALSSEPDKAFWISNNTQFPPALWMLFIHQASVMKTPWDTCYRSCEGKQVKKKIKLLFSLRGAELIHRMTWSLIRIWLNGPETSRFWLIASIIVKMTKIKRKKN